MMQIFVKDLEGKTITLDDVEPGYTVDTIKELVLAKAAVPVAEQLLKYAGKKLEDERTMADYNITKGATLYLNGRLRGGDPKVPLFVLCCLLCAVCAYCVLFAGWRGCP